MSDLPPHPGTPRWVKLFGIIGLLVLLVVIILHLTGRGFRRHGSHSTTTELRSYRS